MSDIRYDVVHVTSAHSALDSRIFYKEAVSASSLGFRVAVVGPAKHKERKHGVDIIPIRKSSNRLLRRLFGPLNILKIILMNRPRIVHFHDPEIIPVSLVMKLCGIKIVYDIHEYYSEIQSLRLSAGILRSFVKRLSSIFLERLPCKLFNYVVFPTKRLREAICVSDRTGSLVNLLPQALIPEYKFDENPEYDLVFMGTISPFRAGPLMEMMQLILDRRPNTKLMMLGTKQETVDWMRQNCPSKQVWASMIFHKKVPHNEVFSVLKKAKIGFNYHPMEPRFEVAIPVKIYEYMASGLAVVSSYFPEIGEQFVNNSEIVLVKGDDQYLLAKSVLELLTGPEKLQKMSKSGYDAVLNRVNWDLTEAQKLGELYHRLLR